MPEHTLENSNYSSFRAFLSAYRTAILIILLVAFVSRLALVIWFPLPAGDESRYTTPAINMLAGFAFSSDVKPPILPSDHTVPLYPLFIAGVYAVFGEHNVAVRIAQSVIDLITCLLVAFVSFNLVGPYYRGPAAMSSLIIYSCLSWFTLFWTRYILTETLAIFLTMLAVTMSIIALRNGPWRWLLVGAICGLAILTRADSVLLVLAFCLFLTVQVARRRSSTSLVRLLLFCSAIPLIVAPWIVRNYLVLGKFQPLASEFGRARGGYVPTGYIRWIRTWMADQTYAEALQPVFHPGSRSFDPHKLPDSTFDSLEERERVYRLIARYDEDGNFTPEISEEFRVLANERIKRAPMGFYLWLPLRRVASMWLTGFATSNPFHRLVRILSVLPILIGGVLGFVISAGNRTVPGLLILIILTRTIFFSFYGSEERYIVEAYPLMIAACGVTCAALWRYLDQLRTLRWNRA